MNPQATVLVTRGSETATLIDGDTVIEAQPPRVEVADTVGAGDASIGGLLFSLMTAPQRGWPEHLRFALAAGRGGLPVMRARIRRRWMKSWRC